jgi:hypothetical protein
VYRLCRHAAIVMACVLAGANVGGLVRADADEALPVPFGEPVNASEANGSVAYLMAVYDLDKNEAVRRLELQRISPQLQEWFRGGYPDEYAGMWIDQVGGGVLKIAFTRPERVAAAVRKLPDRLHVQAVKARWSMRQLEDTAQRLDTKLNADRNPWIRDVEVAVDVPSNAVHVFQRYGATAAGRDVRGRSLAAAQDRIQKADARVSGAVAGESGRAAVKQLVIGEPMDSPVASGCDPRSCLPTMRVIQRRRRSVGRLLLRWLC